MRVVFAGGGTGGHVYPALSVAAALSDIAPANELDLLYLGRAGAPEERLAGRQDIPFRAIHAGQVRGQSPRQTAAGVWRLGQGCVEARGILAAFHADAVFATGGYASVPVALAARWTRIPLLLFLPDVYPGWAVRVAARVATRVATSTDAPLKHLSGRKTVVTGYPLRAEFATARRQTAREHLGLGQGPVLLVTGASTGSRALNDAVLGALPGLLDACEILHLTGREDERRVSEARSHLRLGTRERYHVVAYLDEMAEAMAAADLAVMRAGASCLGEPAAAGLPAILVPGPFSDQRRNADYMVHSQAAVLLEQTALQQRLAPLVRDLLAAPERLEAMANAARQLARPDAAPELANLLRRLAHASWEPEPCVR